MLSSYTDFGYGSDQYDVYGFSTPRATEHHGWFGGKKTKFQLRRMKKKKFDSDDVMILPIVDNRNNAEDDELKQALIPERFVDSTYLIDSIAVAEFEGRLIHELRGKSSNDRSSGSLAVECKPIDRASIGEAIKEWCFSTGAESPQFGREGRVVVVIGVVDVIRERVRDDVCGYGCST
ncbi:unnamed protein product [Lactuca saligna]|uniref:Uncharacterized protein n=1 Tax=Lactuca saligna TaxID=75948 RepID=A0AA35ZUX3_LACSI|nr:unnamed protein product [Lactuca saligna]